MGTGGTAGTADSPTKRDLHRVTTQEKLFQSEFNAPAGHCSVNAGEVRWTLHQNKKFYSGAKKSLNFFIAVQTLPGLIFW